MNEHNKQNFVNGRIASFVFYFAMCLLVIVMELFDSYTPGWFRLVSIIYFVLSVLFLMFSAPGTRVSQSFYTRMQSIFFIVLSLCLWYASGDIHGMLYMFFVQSLIMFMFMDARVYYFQLIVMAILLIIMGFFGYAGHYFERVYGVVCFIVFQWLAITVLRHYNSQIRHMEEQENSLDDIARIMETKCMEAKRATKSKSALLTNMSHEIRTPINSVLGMNEMILRESTEDNIREYAANINSSGRVLVSLINNILDFEKVEANQMEIMPTAYQTAVLIRDLAGTAQVQLEQKNVPFNLQIDPDIPRVLYGDERRIRQVLMTLLNNAIEHVTDGSITLKIEGEERGGNRYMMYCEVSDNGTGISDDVMQNMFVAFQQIDERMDSDLVGTGLGMSLTVRILHLMGAELNIDNSYEFGTKMYFELEQEIVNPDSIGEITLERPAVEAEPEPMFQAPEAKVLVVDDNAMNRKVFGYLMKQSETEVYQAASGQECLELAKEHRFDIIFMDHMMPEMDGVEALHRLREEENLCHESRVVALTANAVGDARAYYIGEGFDEFLSKPIMPEKLERILEEFLPGSYRAAGDGTSGPTQTGGEEREEVSELIPIDGVDWNYAMTHFPDEDMLLHSVRDFYKMMNHEADKLEELFPEIDQSEKLEAYGIQVHGMKSAAASVGIVPLAGCAKMLEDAAKEGDAETVRSVNDAFLREWHKFKDRLKPLAEEEGEKKSGWREDAGLIEELLTEVAQAGEVLDIDLMDGNMEKLNAYEWPEDLSGFIEELGTAVMNLDSEQIHKYVDEIIKGIHEK